MKKSLTFPHPFSSKESSVVRAGNGLAAVDYTIGQLGITFNSAPWPDNTVLNLTVLPYMRVVRNERSIGARVGMFGVGLAIGFDGANVDP